MLKLRLNKVKSVIVVFVIYIFATSKTKSEKIINTFMKQFFLGICASFALTASASNALHVIGLRSDGNSEYFPISEILQIKPNLTNSANPTFDIVSEGKKSTGYKSIRFEGDDQMNAVDQEKSAPQIAVYPNPVQNTIYLTGVDEDSQVEIINMNGVVVKNQQGTEIDVTDLAAGTYLLKVDSAAVKFIKK